MWVSCFTKALQKKDFCHSFFRPISLLYVPWLSLPELLQDGLQGKSGTLLPLSLLGHSVRCSRTDSFPHWSFCTYQFLGLLHPVWTDHHLSQSGVLDLLVPGESHSAVPRTTAKVNPDRRTNMDWRSRKYELLEVEGFPGNT